MDEGLINQVYQAEKEYIALKNQYEMYATSELQAVQQQKVYEYTLESLKAIDNEKVYQPMGKAFIIRDKKDIVDDFEYLHAKTGEDLAKARNYKEVFGGKKSELEKQLVEMTKNLNLAK